MSGPEPVRVLIRQATPADAPIVCSILQEAVQWLEERGIPLWTQEELDPISIREDVGAGLYFLATVEGLPVGVMRFQSSDPLFWPEDEPGDACYVHRLAVRRTFGRGKVSKPLLQFAVAATRDAGRRWLKLDTDAARPRLRQVYEDFGFQYHDDRQVGPFHVARYQLDVGEHP